MVSVNSAQIGIQYRSILGGQRKESTLRKAVPHVKSTSLLGLVPAGVSSFT